MKAYARKHRYRLRNLHDGYPVPPARRQKPDTSRLGYAGVSERWDAIVGRNGYITTDAGQLSVFLEYKSAQGVNLAARQIQAMGGWLDQVGDRELGATVDPKHIDKLLK